MNENGALYDFIFIIMSAQKFVKKISAETGKSGILPALTRRELAGYPWWLADFTKICPNVEYGINRALDEKFLSLVQNVVILDEKFLALNVEDPFFNRVTKLKDLM